MMKVNLLPPSYLITLHFDQTTFVQPELRKVIEVTDKLILMIERVSTDDKYEIKDETQHPLS